MATNQIQLRSERLTPDPVRALFCIDGPPPDVPFGHAIGSVTVSIVVVVVALPDQRGHRAGSLVSVTKEEIAAAPERRPTKGSPRAGRRGKR